VHGVPEDADLPGRLLPRRTDPLVRRPVEAVLLDFHGTIAQVEDALTWVSLAARECGITLDRAKATALVDRLLTAGRAGGPLPRRIPPHLIEVWAERDLSERAHRAAYCGLAATVDTGVEGFPEALYERLLVADGWVLYSDTLPVMRALRAAGVPVALVSNIGFDIRPIGDALGFGNLLDAYVLSYEVGRCKPDPAIFYKACAALRVDPESTLMVGDSPVDAGAAAVGCSVLVLPQSPAGAAHGLAGILRLL
jgi:HAD superfamily hydrolase (TIGR01509 family)